MASNTLPQHAPAAFRADAADEAPMLSAAVRQVLMPLASLKLTVALFAMAIFLIFAGTLAQVDRDIWEVMRLYFRTFFARVEFQIFFPPSFFPNPPHVPGAFYFPGGWLIGGGLMINLLAAHAVRFTVQAKGSRLWGGVAVIAAGILTTALVIVSGDNKNGVQAVPILQWSTLWWLCLGGLAATVIGLGWTFVSLGRQQKLQRAIVAVVTAILATALIWLLSRGESGIPSESSMRILWQLIKGLLAGFVLGLGCWMVFKKRAGIVLLHAGVGLMMANELVVHLWHVEGQMHIKEGQTVNYVQDIRKLELAIVTSKDSDHDNVVAIPESRLLSGEKITHESLPFDLQLVKFYKNSDLRRARPEDQESNPATVGGGLQWIAEEARAAAGADAGGEIDMSAAYVRLFQKGTDTPIDTYLLGLTLSLQDVAEKVKSGDATHDLFLRFKRTYKPYSVALADVRFDKYPGTNTPKNYSSEIRLVDPSRNVDRQVKIWMNNPLRYAGETFYQSSFNVDPSTGTEMTGLQVVANTGWMIPYVGCMLVGLGMFMHFLGVLVRFLNRQSAAELSAAKGSDKLRKPRLEPAGGSMANWLVPVAVVGLAAMWVVSAMQTPRAEDGQMQLYEAGKLPVMYQGRIKPFDTLARNSLRIISDYETFKDAEGRRQPAVKWLLDVIARPSEAVKHKVVRIQNLEVLDVLGLERREGFHYAIEEFQDKMDKFEDQSRRAREKKAADLTVYDKKILELDTRLRLYTVLMAAFDQPRIRPDHASEDLMAIIRHQQATLSKMDLPLAVPPESSDGEWDPYAKAYIRAWAQANVMGQDPNPAALSMNSILVSYARGDVSDFNKELNSYLEGLKKDPPQDLKPGQVSFESFFNHFAPFYVSLVLYVFAFVLTALSWTFWRKPLNNSAFWLIAFTFVIHTFALIARMYISDRWMVMVTNLYSSAIFIGWACVALGLILEAIFKLGIGNAIGSVTGFASLLIAHMLAGDGDTFTVMQAVLDTNFWLATHVTCITLGYATTFMAGFLGLAYILGGQTTPYLSRFGKDVSRMLYGILCFSIFFSFIGTVLGGLWADDSWGRFWGWDPKENGALIIVLWNALVLHARWGGMVKERGMAVLAVGGNIVTAWSWFGVNQLGAGLHSYGFTEGVALALAAFCGTQLLVIAAGLLPKRNWWSFRNTPTA
jgi:ABC-type transport system involved in cytochrome c biogenesis permease subunit